jgi:hypothetical protein
MLVVVLVGGDGVKMFRLYKAEQALQAESIERQAIRQSFAEVNKVNNDKPMEPCTFNKLSPRKQVERINEILGTPNEPDKKLK